MKFSCGTATFLKNTADTIGSAMATVDWSAVGHAALDAAGMLPVVGTAADVLNGVWYAAEGNYVDAAMSFASAIPVVGDAIGAGKFAAKASTTLLTAGASKGILAGASAFGGAVLSKSGRLTDNVIDEVDQGTAFIERMAQYAGESSNNAKAIVDVPEKTVLKANDPYHANDLRSQREQHGYLIFRENQSGDVELAKFGISSTPLNKNGTSTSANSQVNKFNKESNEYSYFAIVLPETMKGRELATTWEKEMANSVSSEKLKLEKHKIP